MSLINEALKKAQRQRNEVPEDPAAAASGAAGGRIAKRAQPRSANAIFLLATGAVVLVLVSVGLTAYLVNRPAPKPAPVAAITPAPTQTPSPATPIAAPPPIAIPPLAAPAAEKPAAEAAPAPAVAASTPPPAVAAAAEKPAAAAETKPAPVAEPAPAPQPPPVDERVNAFVESVRSTGVKAAGDESRVLMNERVYRLNDVVDRTLNVRLTKVDASSLTFTDANGATYVKYF
jgi:hypothetical protein